MCTLCMCAQLNLVIDLQLKMEKCLPDRLSIGTIVPYWPSQMSARESVNIRPQKRFVDRLNPSEKSMAIDDGKNR